MEFALRSVLDTHIRLYPAMQEQDLVKLIFQGEFGGGHLLSDFNRCLLRVIAEYSEIKQNPDAPLWEDIGFGFARIRMDALDANGMDPEDLAELFFSSASVSYGSMETYRQKLSRLPSLIDSRFLFRPAALEAYLEKYINNGAGMLSHSALYRNLYHPAYRVVRCG